MHGIDPAGIDTPAFVIDLEALERNLALLGSLQGRAGCKVLLALKAFAAWPTFPLVKRHLAGVAASSPWEAQLGREEVGGEVHAYAPAYGPADFRQILRFADHVVFNSCSQVRRLGPIARAEAPEVELGLRLNPEHREVAVALYDPCAPGSRLGVTAAELDPAALEGLAGLHFHTLCELGADALERTLPAVEAKFGRWFEGLRWLNFGGGHHITRPDYDVELLVQLVTDFRQRTGLEVYLEPGEAAAIRTGVLVTSVLDVVRSGGVEVAILDTSATAHMPDVLEMPYRPDVVGGAPPGEQAHTYRLAGVTCLAGDVIGDYSFAEPLAVGRKLVFLDMSHYTMVKTTFFNGVQHPDLVLWHAAERRAEVVRRFGYEDFKRRLG